MNINHLRYFNEVCKYGSIAKAAEKLFVSPPSITAAIQGLEKDLGYRLFERQKNHLILNEDGRKFHELNQKFLNSYRDFQSQAYDISANRSRKIRVGIPSIMTTFFISMIYPSFQEIHPEIELEIISVGTIAGLEMLARSELDCTLGIDDGRQNSQFDSQHLFTTELQFVVNKNNPLAERRIIDPVELEGIPMAVIPAGSFHHQATLDLFKGQSINVVLFTSQLATIKYMLDKDCAATIIYKNIFRDQDNLAFIPLKETLSAPVHIFWQKHSYVAQATNQFIRFLKELDY